MQKKDASNTRDCGEPAFVLPCIAKSKRKDSVKDSERLLIERRRRGFAAWKLAANADMDPTTYSHIERGEREATIDQQRRLARALGVEPETIFTGGAR